MMTLQKFAEAITILSKYEKSGTTIIHTDLDFKVQGLLEPNKEDKEKLEALHLGDASLYSYDNGEWGWGVDFMGP